MGNEFLNADLQVLMDQLRQKAHVMRSWNDIIKIAKTNFMEKRNPLDAEDRAQLQQSLESLRKTVSVTSQKELFDLLEEMCSRLGLKFGPIPSSGNFSCYISPDSECFMMEIRCKENGYVENIEIFFADQTQSSCPSLTALMNERKWSEVEENLKKLASICLLTNDRSINLDIFLALKTLEENFERSIKEISTKTPLIDLILTGPHGYFVPKEAGRLARLHYFVSPYDLLNVKEQRFFDPNLSDFSLENRGLWANLSVENHSELQNLFADQSYKRIPAVFTLEMNENCLISDETLSKLEDLTGFKPSTSESGNVLILAAQKIVPNFGRNSSPTNLFVKLPDQNHKYNLNSTTNQRLSSCYLKKIYFVNSSTTLMNQIFDRLRRDAAYTATFTSCVRCENSSKTNQNFFHFELSSPDFGRFECLFEHPYDDGFISMKLVCAADPQSNHASLIWLQDDERSLPVSDEFATKVFRKCLSIPVTMRAVMKKLLEAKPLDKNLKSFQSRSDTADDRDDESMDFDDDERSTNLTIFKENAQNINGEQQNFDGGTKYWQSYNLPTNFNHTKLITKRYDIQKAVEFALNFDELALNQKLPNMLDLFKELDEWEELIPPRVGQKPLKSPAPICKQRPQTLPPFPAPSPVVAAPSNISSSSGPASVQSATGRSPKMRHVSSTSDTFGELEQLLNLSKSFNTDGSGNGGPGSESDSISSTPVTDRPAPILERKSSLQDTIDSVAMGNQLMAAAAAAAAAQQQGQQGMMNVGIGGGQRQMMPSRSFDVDYTMSSPPHQQPAAISQRMAMSAGPNSVMDVFDFDKSEAFDTPAMQRWQSYSGEPESTMQAGSMGYNPDAAMQTYTQGQYALRGMLSTVGRGGTVRRRRQRRNMANVGDRSMEMALKEMNKELRKAEKAALRGAAANKPPRRRGVRRPRGGPGHLTSTHMMEMGGDGKMRVKFMHPGMSPDDDDGSNSRLMAEYQQTPGTPGGGMQLPYGQHPAHQQQQQHMYQQHNNMNTMMALKDLYYKDFHQTGPGGQMSQGLDVEAEDYQDDAGSSSGGLKDENLRRQIHAVVQETIYSEDPAFQQLRDREDLTGSASLDHRLMPDLGAGVGGDDGDGSGGVAGNLFDNLSARLKPGKRKGSLDDVIGKLTAGVFQQQSSVGSSESDEMGSSAFDSFEESQPKRIRLDDDDSPDEIPRHSEYHQSMSIVEHRKEQQPQPAHQEMLSVAKSEYDGSTPTSSEGGQPIKLVIKKKDLKIPMETSTSMARAILSSRLAKSSEMSKLGQQAAMYAQQQQMKRSSPVTVEQSSKIGVQYTQSGSEKKSSKFSDLKQRLEERKFKKSSTAKPPTTFGVGDPSQYGKLNVTDVKTAKNQEKYALKSPKLDLDRKSAEKILPYVKVATPTDLTAIPGTEGILFSKSLAGYKIPKVDDTAKGGVPAGFQPPPLVTVNVYSQQQPPANQSDTKNPGLQSPPRKPPFQPPPQTKVPKPILKHSHSTPPPPQQAQLQYAAQQKMGEFKRRPLLPDPTPRFPSTERGISATMGSFMDDFQSHYAVGGDSQDQCSRSPDAEQLIIDDAAIRSPLTADQNLHNTSKDSDLSPGLRIDTDAYGMDEPVAVTIAGQSPEVS